MDNSFSDKSFASLWTAFSMERGAGYVPEPVSLEPNGVQATMFIYQGEPNDEWLSDENVSIKDNIKEWRN